MSPVAVTFSRPVARVRVTALDPTWEGNTATAFGAGGEALGTQAFPYSRVPGVFTEPSVVFAGVIGCPTPVLRAQVVSCPISVPSGRAFRVVSLTATADGETRPLPVSNPDVAGGSTFPLTGPAVAGTTINVAVDIDIGGGQTRNSSATVSFVVTPRSLLMVAPEPTDYVIGPGADPTTRVMFRSPYDATDSRRVAMADTVFSPPGPSVFEISYATSGPNMGFGYVPSVAALPPTVIRVNPHAVAGPWVDDQNGGTWRNEVTSAVYPGCTQAQYRNILFLRFLLHEGLPATREESHVRLYRNGLPLLSSGIESLRVRAADIATARTSLRQMGVYAWWAWYNGINDPIQLAFDRLDESVVWENGFNCKWDMNRSDP